MGFSQTAITDVLPSIHHGDLFLSWTTTAPAGTCYQVYVNKVLAWYGRTTACRLPMPANGRQARVDVGTVAAGEDSTNFTASLPAVAGTGRVVTLAWLGGTYESTDDDVAGFHVYQGLIPGGAVSYTTPVDTVAAYPQGILTDGAGIGMAGEGTAGRSAGDFEWESPPLPNGVWNFGVKSFDAAGNESATALTYAATISGPPVPPAANAAGLRLSYTFSAITHKATLSWLASPG